MRTLIFSCLGLMLLGTIAAEMEYDREDLMNFISSLLQSGTGESAGPAVGDENIDTDGDNELAYPMVKRGKMTQEICRRECSSCSKVMNVLFMSCWRDCQLSSTGRSPHNVWSTCRRFLTG
uniref:Neuropeptide 11-like n=1 Tax=Stichopus japonicus TaxID=307972 RepID=A0A2Z4C1B2_STIJA|nr:np11 precursor [Apostichopus japonicus]AXU40280.1 neuropeptide precursor 11-like precursor [Apostichopus japonicus]